MKRRRLLFNTMEIDLESLMYIDALEDGLSVSFSRNTIYYSIDEAKTWASLSPNRTTPVINAGCKIYFKAH